MEKYIDSLYHIIIYNGSNGKLLNEILANNKKNHSTSHIKYLIFIYKVEYSLNSLSLPNMEIFQYSTIRQ